MIYQVEFTAIGRGIAAVSADSQEEAERKAKDGDFLIGSVELLEYEYDEITQIYEGTGA